MIGIVTNQEFEQELSDLNNGSPISRPIINEKVIDIKHGRGPKKEVPSLIRQEIAKDAISGIPAKTISELYDISSSSISAYKEGSTSTAFIGKRVDTSLLEAVQLKKQEIGDSARGRLLAALDSLTDDKIEKAKAKDIASIAKDMSVVVRNTEGQGGFQVNNQQVNIYRPRMKEEDDYDVIEVDT